MNFHDSLISHFYLFSRLPLYSFLNTRLKWYFSPYQTKFTHKIPNKMKKQKSCLVCAKYFKFSARKNLIINSPMDLRRLVLKPEELISWAIWTRSSRPVWCRRLPPCERTWTSSQCRRRSQVSDPIRMPSHSAKKCSLRITTLKFVLQQ